MHLSIGTNSENQLDRPEEDRLNWGRKNGQKGGEATRRAVELTNTATGEVFTFEGVRQAARELGLHHPLISAVCKGKKRTTGGYTARHV